MKKEFKVYALVKNKKCVYVGCSCNLKNRLSYHKSKKDYDNHIVLSTHDNKKDALLAERSIIKFLSVFGGEELLNGKYYHLCYEGVFDLGLDEDLKNY